MSIIALWRAASTVWKVLSIAIPILTVIGGYLAWKYHQQSIGYERHEREVAQELLQQKEEALGHFLVEQKQKQLLENQVIRHKDSINAKLRQHYQALLEKEQAHDDTTPICVVDAELVTRVNDLGRLLQSVSQDGAASTE